MSDDVDRAAVWALVQNAEVDAERTTGWVRIGIALTLAGGVLAATPWTSGEADPGYSARVIIAEVTVAGFLALGVTSLVAVSTGVYRPWMAFAFTAGDAALLSINAWATLHLRQLGGDWLAALPAVLAAPLMLCVGTLRYRPSVQLWATACFVAGLSSVALIRGLGDLEPRLNGTTLGAVSAEIAPFFSPPANAMRLLILLLTAATTVYVMIRGHRLLIRAAADAVHRMNLERFLPPEVAPLVAPGAGRDWRSGHRLQVAIMFVDLRGSTNIAEEMDPAQLSIFISSFRRRVMRAAKTHQGVIDKFIGDGALIVFGLPEPRPDDADRAARCGREILRAVESWSAKRRFDPPVRAGIGIHLGEAYCGIVGDEERLEFTVLGDAVNVAARIEQATKEFGEPLLVSETIAETTGGAAEWREVARSPLRGRHQAIGLFAPRA